MCGSSVENNKLKEETDELILLLEDRVQWLICLILAKLFLFESVIRGCQF